MEKLETISLRPVSSCSKHVFIFFVLSEAITHRGGRQRR